MFQKRFLDRPTVSSYERENIATTSCTRSNILATTKQNQRTNGPVNAHLISGPIISTKHTKPENKNKAKKWP